VRDAEKRRHAQRVTPQPACEHRDGGRLLASRLPHESFDVDVGRASRDRDRQPVQRDPVHRTHERFDGASPTKLGQGADGGIADHRVAVSEQVFDPDDGLTEPQRSAQAGGRGPGHSVRADERVDQLVADAGAAKGFGDPPLACQTGARAIKHGSDDSPNLGGFVQDFCRRGVKHDARFGVQCGVKDSLKACGETRARGAGSCPRPLGQALQIDLGSGPRVQSYYWDGRSIRGDVGTLSAF